MTALISALVNVMGTLYIGIILINPNGTVNSNGSTTVSAASSSQADIRSAINSATVSYASGLGYTISASDVVSELYQPTTRTFTYPTRSLNSAFQVSTTQDAFVSYSASIAATLTLVTGQSGTVTLEYADDSGFTTNVVTVQNFTNGNTGTLAVGLGLSQTVSGTLSAIIPAGKWVKLVTSGSATTTMSTTQEVLL